MIMYNQKSSPFDPFFSTLLVNAPKPPQFLRLLLTCGGKLFNKLGETIKFVLKESLISSDKLNLYLN